MSKKRLGSQPWPHPQSFQVFKWQLVSVWAQAQYMASTLPPMPGEARSSLAQHQANLPPHRKRPVLSASPSSKGKAKGQNGTVHCFIQVPPTKGKPPRKPEAFQPLFAELSCKHCLFLAEKSLAGAIDVCVGVNMMNETHSDPRHRKVR